MYIGPSMQLENRYSQIIGMTFIIMLYSASIPCLYLAGFIICITMYWSDKILFLRHWRTPPKFGIEVSARSNRIMEWSILVHLMFGAFMLTNQDIFNENASIEDFWYSSVTQVVGDYSAYFGIDPTRFQSLHAVIYLFGTSVFVVLFFFERFGGLVSRLFTGVCCCLRLRKEVNPFSTNIFENLSFEDLEYEH
jgi:hypothetical protein